MAPMYKAIRVAVMTAAVLIITDQKVSAATSAMNIVHQELPIKATIPMVHTIMIMIVLAIITIKSKNLAVAINL